MSSAFINFKTSTPCIFTIDGISKFGIRTEQEFLRISRVVSGAGQFQTVCVPVDDPENVTELAFKTTESELQEMGLSGDTLQIAKTFLGEYIAEANRVEIGESGGIEALISALRAHPTNEKVQKHACKAISVIALNDKNKKAFIDQGAVPLLIHAFGMGGNVEMAAAQALYVLNNQTVINQMQDIAEMNDGKMLDKELPE